MFRSGVIDASACSSTHLINVDPRIADPTYSRELINQLLTQVTSLFIKINNYDTQQEALNSLAPWTVIIEATHQEQCIDINKVTIKLYGNPKYVRSMHFILRNSATSSDYSLLDLVSAASSGRARDPVVALQVEEQETL